MTKCGHRSTTRHNGKCKGALANQITAGAVNCLQTQNSINVHCALRKTASLTTIQHDSPITTPFNVAIVFTLTYIEMELVVAQSVHCLTTDWTGVRSPPQAKNFSSSLCVQTTSEAHPASYPINIPGVLSSEVKHGRGVTLTTHIHLVPKLRMIRSYISSPA
jgi:hypothetical protein